MAKKSTKSTVSPVTVEEVKVTPGTKAVQKVDFDVWYSRRVSIIPPVHYKEIIQTDFKARGLSTKETMESYDAALAKYGIKI